MLKSVQSEVKINASPQRVLEALVQPQDLTSWWGVHDSYVQPKDGGQYTLAWKKEGDSFQYVSTGRIECYIPGSLLYLDNLMYLNPERPILGPFSIAYTVLGDENSTTLSVSQEGYEEDDPHHDWLYSESQSGWRQALDMLKQHLEE